MAGWLIPAVLGAASTLFGKQSSDKQAKVQQQAIGAQQSSDAAKQALFDQQMTLANKFLFGGTYDQMDESGNLINQTQIAGAVPQAQEWQAKFLDWLRTSPDITYNAQRGVLERQIQNSMKAVSGSGVTPFGVQSGLVAKVLGDIGMQRAGMIAGLEGERQDRMGQRLSAGVSLTQDAINRALNMRSGGLGLQANFQSSTPQLLAGMATGYGDQANAYGNMAGSLLNYALASQSYNKAMPASTTKTAAAPAGPAKQAFIPSAASSNPYLSYLLSGVR